MITNNEEEDASKMHVTETEINTDVHETNPQTKTVDIREPDTNRVVNTESTPEVKLSHRVDEWSETEQMNNEEQDEEYGYTTLHRKNSNQNAYLNLL